MYHTGGHLRRLVRIISLGDDDILHLQASLLHLELGLFDGTFLLGDGIAELELVELGQNLTTAHLLTIMNKDTLDGQGRLERQVGEVFGHHFSHCPHPAAFGQRQCLLHRFASNRRNRVGHSYLRSVVRRGFFPGLATAAACCHRSYGHEYHYFLHTL